MRILWTWRISVGVAWARDYGELGLGYLPIIDFFEVYNHLPNHNAGGNMNKVGFGGQFNCFCGEREPQISEISDLIIYCLDPFGLNGNRRQAHDVTSNSPRRYFTARNLPTIS